MSVFGEAGQCKEEGLRKLGKKQSQEKKNTLRKKRLNMFVDMWRRNF
jgi:hypothetical protein